MKVMTVVGTRPEIIKLSRVIPQLDQYTDHVLVHTGQNHDYELNEVFFENLDVRKPDIFLEAAEPTAAATIARVIEKIDAVLEKEQPDALLIYGDTNSCLCVIPAKRRKVPIFHCEAGNRCFDFRVPEEINRRLVDHLSDVNMPLTEHARRYLIAEGIRPDLIIKTGSPMKEVLAHHKQEIANSNILSELKVEQNNYFIVSAHREENVDNEENMSELMASLDYLSETFSMPVLVSTHPRTRKRIEEFGLKPGSSQVRLLKPLGFFDYNKLQLSAKCVLSDSGTLSEESSILGFPGVMLRNAHERPEGMDNAVSIMTGHNAKKIERAVNVLLEQKPELSTKQGIVNDYDTEIFSTIVFRTILSYTDYVNQTVWRKS